MYILIPCSGSFLGSSDPSMCHTCSSSTRCQWGCAPQRKRETVRLPNTSHSQRLGKIPLLAPLFLVGPQLLGARAPSTKDHCQLGAGGALYRCLWKDGSRWDVWHVCLVPQALPRCSIPAEGWGKVKPNWRHHFPQGKALLFHLYLCFPWGSVLGSLLGIHALGQ